MGVFGAYFGCSGDDGSMLACISGCRGVIGSKVGTCLCPVREKVRPARSDRGREREKVRPASPKRLKNAVFRRAGRVFSRRSRWKPRAGRTFSRVSPRGSAAGRILSRNGPDAFRAGRTLSCHWRRWHALRLPVSPARRADHSQAEADRALLPQTNRPPTHHAGAGGNTKNAWDSSSNEQCTRCTRR